MRHYVQTLVRQHADCGLPDLLHQIVAKPALHARFVNTLSRMEYVGVRKMLKARHSDHLNLDGLQHVIEESSHALRLKRAALALDPTLETYSAAHTLAGAAGEKYLQDVDAACQLALHPPTTPVAMLTDGAELTNDAKVADDAEVTDDAKMANSDDAGKNLADDAGGSEANYLLSSAAIEVRADAFYPAYEKALVSAGSPYSVRAILKDEQRHLAEMAELLHRTLPNWRTQLELALQAEQRAFAGWFDAMKLGLEHFDRASSLAEPSRPQPVPHHPIQS
jgi:hypothetical protein